MNASKMGIIVNPHTRPYLIMLTICTMGFYHLILPKKIPASSYLA